MTIVLLVALWLTSNVALVVLLGRRKPARVQRPGTAGAPRSLGSR